MSTTLSNRFDISSHSAYIGGVSESSDRPTISDVARRASVSPSTASLVFSGKGRVSPATRARVTTAAKELGYTGPDPRAASLRTGRSGIIGVVLEQRIDTAFRDPITTLMLDGLADAVAPLGSGLLLLRDLLPEDEVDDSAGALSLRSAPVDAVVLVGCSGRLAESVAVVRGRGIPVVVIEGDAGEGIPKIGLDNREAQRTAAEHIRDLGHSHVVVLALPFDVSRDSGWIDDGAQPQVDVTRDRLLGIRDVYPDAPVYSAVSRIDEGLTAGLAILADPETRPTAIIAQSDMLAAGVLRAAAELGIRVPEELSVTGFDGVDIDGLAPRALTTLVQPATAKGRAAGDALARMLRGEPADAIQFTCEFRLGDSTGPVPGQ